MLFRRHALSLALALSFALFPALRAAHAAGHALHGVEDSGSLDASCALCAPLHGAVLGEAPAAPSVTAPATSPCETQGIAPSAPTRTLEAARARAPPCIG